MEWQVILALIFAVTVILFPAVFIWYLNIGGMYTAFRERGGIRVPAIIKRATRVMLVGILPVAVYAVAIWFFYGHILKGLSLLTGLTQLCSLIFCLSKKTWVLRKIKSILR